MMNKNTVNLGLIALGGLIGIMLVNLITKRSKEKQKQAEKESLEQFSNMVRDAINHMNNNDWDLTSLSFFAKNTMSIMKKLLYLIEWKERKKND